MLSDLTEQRQEIWTVQYQQSPNTKPIQLSSDLPSQHYSFSPVVLSSDAVNLYHSIPALAIYADHNLTNVVGIIGNGYRAISYEADRVYLKSGSITGWVPLPFLSEKETEVTFFTSGLVRALRGDWRGAAELFDKVEKQTKLPETLRIDVLLLRGLAEEKQGRSGLPWFVRAYEINPLRSGTCKYLIQGIIQAGNQTQSGNNIDIRQVVNNCRPIFDVNDEWLIKVDQVLSSFHQ